MTRWREYQEETAALFRSVGLNATTDERIEGARGKHAVDVVVRSRRAGLTQLWVVECKWRQRPVEKLHVAALTEIVRDTGADRGILLSEVGFQAGALQMAARSNITLTSLTELREDTAEEVERLRLGESRKRLSQLRDRLSSVGSSQRRGRVNTWGPFRTALGRWSFTILHAHVSVAEEGLQRAEAGRWPAPYTWDMPGDVMRYAPDLTTFIVGIEAALDTLEEELAAFEEVNPTARTAGD